jgi:hypothetical protein
VSAVSIIKAIKTGKWEDEILRLRDTEDEEEQDVLKRKLPAVTFSGVFSPRRSLESCVKYNHVVVFDIDKLEHSELERVEKELRSDPHVLVMFRSPRGNGLKGLVPVTSGQVNHLDAFECLSMYFKSRYNVKLDASGKDICRLCFVSYDPELHYNGAAIPMQVELRQEQRAAVYSDTFLNRKGVGVAQDDRMKFEVAQKWAQYHCKYEEGSRNNHVFILACSLNRIGVEQDRSSILMIGEYTDLPVKEINDIVRKVYLGKKAEFNTQTVQQFEEVEEASKDAFIMSDISEIIDDMTDDSENNIDITTGSSHIDSLIGGIIPGYVMSFVGPEKSYKSVYAVHMAIANAKRGVDVCYANGEMSSAQFTVYLTRQLTGLNTGNKSVLKANADRVKEEYAKIKDHFHLFSGSDFNEENIIVTLDAIRAKTGRDVKLLVIDGINHMEDVSKDEIRSAISNSKIAKEIAKKANQGRSIAIALLMHTTTNCLPWFRQPQNFTRGGTAVRRNLDMAFGFSRFVTADSFPDGNIAEYDLRNDLFHLKVMDYRGGGETIDQVMQVSNCMEVTPSDLAAEQFEVKPKKQGGRYD